MTSGWRQNGTHGHMSSRTVAHELLPAGRACAAWLPTAFHGSAGCDRPSPTGRACLAAPVQRGTQGSDLGLLSQGSISRALCRDKVTISVLLPLSYCLKKEKKKLKRKKKDKEIEGERRARMLRFCHRRCQPATWPPQGHPQPDHRRRSREAFLCLPAPRTAQRATPLSS